MLNNWMVHGHPADEYNKEHWCKACGLEISGTDAANNDDFCDECLIEEIKRQETKYQGGEYERTSLPV